MLTAESLSLNRFGVGAMNYAVVTLVPHVGPRDLRLILAFGL